MPNIIFAGTPQSAAVLLETLIQKQYHVSHVYTQPDRPTGRGQHVLHTPVKECAIAHGIPVLQPENFKDPAHIRTLMGLKPDILVVVAYGLLLPESVLSIPRWGCINVHFSLLPRWRGAAPVQRAIQAGDKETGISIMQLDKGLDTGPILMQTRCEIRAQETAEQLLERLTLQACEPLLQTIDNIKAGRAIPQAQDNTRATYAKRIDKSEAQIDWQLSANEIAHLIAAFNPWPVAFTTLDETRLRIFAATALSSPSSHPPGVLLRASKAGIEVATGNGILQITQLQLPNRRVMSAADILNAHQALFKEGKMLQ